MSATPQKPTRAEREWQRRHREILKSAWELFMEKGFAGATMQEIAERSEYSVGYLYKHFPGKEDLREAIFAEHYEVYKRIRAEVFADLELSPLEGIRLEMNMMCEHLADNPGLVSLFKGPAGISGKIQKRIRDIYRSEDVQRLQEAMDAGEIQTGDPSLLMAACDGVFTGLVQVITESGHPERYTEIPSLIDDLILKPVEIKKNSDTTTN